jgi:hypothetical protein
MNHPSGSHAQLFTSTPSVFSYSPQTLSIHSALPHSTAHLGQVQGSLDREDEDSDEMEDMEDADSQKSDTVGCDGSQGDELVWHAGTYLLLLMVIIRY